MAILREKDGRDLVSEFLTLPFEAIRELLSSDQLVLDSENTALVRGACGRGFQGSGLG